MRLQEYLDPDNAVGFMKQTLGRLADFGEVVAEDPKGVASEVWDGMHPMDKAALATAPIPIVGDITGLAADARMYYEEPESRTPANFMMTAAGALPFVPSAVGQKTVSEIFGGVKRIKLPRGVERPGAFSEMDPRKFMQEKMNDLTIDAERVAFDKPDISLADYEGKNALVTMTDRTSAGDLIHGANGVKFGEPLRTGGGDDYMFEHPGEAWALASGGATGVLNKGSDMLVLPMRMSTSSVDFPTMAPSTHIRYADKAMAAKDQKYVNKLIKSGGAGAIIKSKDGVPVPDFPGMDSPDIDKYLSTLTGPQRKTINNVFDMVANPSPSQIMQGIRRLDGALTNTEMRMIITDPEQLSIPSLMQLENVAMMHGGRSRGPHATYDTSLSGEGLGRLDRPITAQDMLPELFPRSTPNKIDSKDAYTARLGQRIVTIDEPLLGRLGY